MKVFLILLLFGRGMVVVPEPFTSFAACKDQGEAFSAANNSSRGYYCIITQ